MREKAPIHLPGAGLHRGNRIPFQPGPALVRKVNLFLAHGTRLAWVINPSRRLVTIYRLGQTPETLHDPETLHGEDVLPGFVFAVRERIFDNID